MHTTYIYLPITLFCENHEVTDVKADLTYLLTH